MTRKSLILILLFLLIGFSIIFMNYQQSEKEIGETGITVNLYFATKDAMYLEAEERIIKSEGVSSKYMETIKQLITGPHSNKLTTTIPQGVEILDIEHRGETAYLNFNEDLVNNHWGGSTGEIMTVYSIVNTMTQFPEISSVKIMIENKEIETLAGHLDLSVSLERDENIIKKE
mgnify:CR=1 FL=1